MLASRGAVEPARSGPVPFHLVNPWQSDWQAIGRHNHERSADSATPNQQGAKDAGPSPIRHGNNSKADVARFAHRCQSPGEGKRSLGAARLRHQPAG